MTLILLAVSAAITLCVIAHMFAIYALPFMVGLSAARFAYAADAGWLMSGLAGVGAALFSVVLVIAVLTITKRPALRMIALIILVVPAAVAGYSLVHGVTHNAIASPIALNLLCGLGGLFSGISAMLNLNACGTSLLSR